MINCLLFYGLDSPEHDVSVVTATEIMRNAPSRGIRRPMRLSTKSGLRKWLFRGKRFTN